MFHEATFPFSLQFGMGITIKYKTSIVSTQSLHEERLCQWLDCLRTYSIVPVLFDRGHFQTLGNFFRARSGRENAFRLRDPIDHEVSNQSIGIGDGARTVWQVYKAYESGIDGDTYTAKRPLMKLVAPVVVFLDDEVLDPSNYTVDLTTGLLTFYTAPILDAVVSVSCLFDTPVRFSTNRLGTNHATFEAYNPNGVELIEDRLPMELLTNPNIIETVIPGSIEARYPFHEQLSDESEFASRYSDSVISFDSGFEHRQRRSAQGYNDYELQYQVKPLSEIQRLVSFYHCRKGRYGGFRLKDINDYEAEAQPLGVSDGITYEFQMQKVYAAGSESELRTITKPLEGTISLYGNTVLLSLSTEHMSIDYATGKVLYFLSMLYLDFESVGKTITRSLTFNPGTWIADGLAIGDKVSIVGSLMNNRVFTVTTVSDYTLTVTEDVATEFAEVSIYLPPLTGITLTWSGEFDVPVRFNTDELQVSINGFEPYNVDNLSLQEIHTEPLEAIYNDPPAFTSGPLVCAGAPSALLGLPDVAVLDPVLQLSYSHVLSDSPSIARAKEIHGTWKGISSWTLMAVFSHSKRGVLFDIPQGYPQGYPAYTTDGDSVHVRPTTFSLSTRVFVRSVPTNKAVLFIEGWNGDNTLTPYYHYNGYEFVTTFVDYLDPDEVYSGKLAMPLYTSPEEIVYEPTTALIITFSYFSAKAYVSGTAAGIVRVGPDNPYVDSVEVDEFGNVISLPADRYANGPSTLWYEVHPFFGAFCSGLGGSAVPHIAGSLGRFYEVYFAQYYGALTAETEVVLFKQLHNYLIRYLEAKYLYRRKAALALNGTRGHWTATRDSIYTLSGLSLPDETFRLAEVGEAVHRWLPDLTTGSLAMVSKSGMHSHTRGTLVAVEPNQTFLETPLKAWWDN